MNYKPILIIGGDPKSIFFEIFFKTLKKIKVKNPILLITSHKLLKEEMNLAWRYLTTSNLLMLNQKL